MQVAWCGILFAVLIASRSFAALQVNQQCQSNWKWQGEPCEEDLNCVLLGNRYEGYCLDFNCTKWEAPETILPSPTTVIVDTVTTALHLHTVNIDQSCQCWPTQWYTTTITATPPPYSYQYPYIGDCTIYPNGECLDGASCITLSRWWPQNPMCATAKCLDPVASMTTKYWPSTIFEAGPGATTVTVTDTLTRLVVPTTPTTTCTCIGGPSPTITRTYYVSPTPAP